MHDGVFEPVLRGIHPHVDLEDRRKSIEDRAAEMRVAGHVPTHELRYGAAAARTERTEIARLDLRGNPVIREWRSRTLSTAHVMRIAMRKDDHVSRREHDGLSVFHLDETVAVNQQMIEDEMRRTRSDLLRQKLRSRR